MVIDPDEPFTSSKVAAGLVTPIAGQSFSLPNEIDTTLQFAKKTYWEIEEMAGATLFHHRRIARLFHNSKEQQKWQKRIDSEDSEKYTSHYTELDIDSSLVHSEMGGIELTKGGWLDVAHFLQCIQQYLMERLAYAIGTVHSDDLQELSIGQTGIKWRNITATHAIFCQGCRGEENTYFRSIAMDNARGDIIHFNCPELLVEPRILNRNGWILPTGKAAYQFRAGATYDHDYIENRPTESGRHKVCEKITSIITPKFEVTDHQSAIRPIITRSDPYFMGVHPEYPALVYFNGLGSKGVTHAPLATRLLVEHLLDGTPLQPENDIRERFDF